MMNITDSKESRAAQEFLMKSTKAFEAKIARGKVNNIDISVCTQDETYTALPRFQVVGSVEITSPTGKLKTYGYHATVDVNLKDCTLASLEVEKPEE
ncbi:MAG: hypothetical protein IJR88_03645 [Clostridia bacterium]|nr:hypothetical protein [Clostridia bacterium]